MIRYHDSPRNHDASAQDKRVQTDSVLLDHLENYEVGGRSRGYLTTRDYGQDHRAWRRAVIREALRRGLISEDPGDAP